MKLGDTREHLGVQTQPLLTRTPIRIGLARVVSLVNFGKKGITGCADGLVLLVFLEQIRGEDVVLLNSIVHIVRIDHSVPKVIWKFHL